jgi:hypothetical protein
LARNASGKREMGVHVLPGDAAPRISEPASGYQYVVASFDKQGYKKFYRVSDTALTDLLPTSRTADGLTPGPKGILFFHVGSSAAAASSATGASAPAAGMYGIRLHWLSFNSGIVRHLGRTIDNAQPALKLAWLDDTRFEYTLSDGTSETVSTADFK